MPLSTEYYGYIVDPFFSFMDDKGKTIKNGFLRVFLAGSSTPAVTYLNWNGAMNQETIQLDNSGRCYTRVIGAKDTLYKVCVYDSHHSQETPLITVDNIQVLGAVAGVLDGSITTAKLADEAVTREKIHEGAVTDLKLAPSIRFNRASSENQKGYCLLNSDASLSEQIVNENTIYEIRWPFLLGDDDHIIIPEGCELKFNGGSIVGGSIEFHNTFLSGDVLIESNWLGRVSNDEVNLRWLGAKEGGTYDCSPAFNRAIDYVNNSERFGTHLVVLKIDSGNWGIGSTINFNGSSEFLIRGDDSNYTTITPITTMDWMFINISGDYSGISFEHIRFDGIETSESGIYDNTQPLGQRFNKDYSTRASGCINFPNEYYCRFNNVEFRHFSGTSLRFDNLWNVNFYDVTFRDCGVGLRTIQPNGFDLKNCEFRFIKDFGIVANGSFVIDVHNNIFEIIGKSAIFFVNGGQCNARYNYFEDCSIDGVDVYNYQNNAVLYKAYPQIMVGFRLLTDNVVCGGPLNGIYTIEGNSIQVWQEHSSNDCAVALGNCGKLVVEDNDIAATDIPIIGLANTTGVYIDNLYVKRNTQSGVTGGYRDKPSSWTKMKCFATDNQGTIVNVIVDNSAKYHDENLTKYLYQSLYLNKSFTSTGEIHDGNKVYVTAEASSLTIRQNYQSVPFVDDLDATGEYIVVEFERVRNGNWGKFTYVLDGTFSFTFSLEANMKFTMPKIYFLSGKTTDKSDSLINIPTMTLAEGGWGLTAYTNDVVNITKDSDYVSAKMMSNGYYKKTLTSGIVEYSANINDAIIGDKAFKTDAPKKPLWYDGSQWIDGAGTVLA